LERINYHLSRWQEFEGLLYPWEGVFRRNQMTIEFHHNPVRVAVIGAGNVGASFAYALLLSGLAPEIVLIDANNEKATGEAMDLNHAIPLAQTGRVWAGTYEDCAGASVVVITAGSAQKPGESRLNLLQRNISIFKQIIPQVVHYNPNGILLIATNPVDILTYAAWRISGLPDARVVGSGTILDTARFRFLLSQEFDVDPRSVHAYIIGEHGDSEVPVWSLANIAGMRLEDYCAANNFHCIEERLKNIFEQTRDAAYHIIKLKGATYYAIGAGLLRIVEAILRDQGTVLSVSSLMRGYYGIDDVYLSLPCKIDRSGVVHPVHLQLNKDEQEGLLRSAKVLKDTIAQLEF
jgi:L-lactate dehydrogenase